MAFTGLTSCSLQILSSSPPCIQKAIQFSFTVTLLVAIVINLLMRVSYQRQFNLYVLINALMILTLVFNAFFTLFAIKELYRFENLFFDSYFPTLVYKFGLKLLEKNREITEKYRQVIVVLFVLYLLLVFGDFIYINVLEEPNCKEIPYLLVNLSGVSLSIWLAIFGYQHLKLEQEKNEIINQNIVADSEKYTNPMPKMWKCIVINILSQVIGLGRTIYYVADPSMGCRFTSNEKAEVAIQFTFLVATYYMGMVATLLFFNEKRKSYFQWNRSHPRKSSDDQKVQLINVSHFEGKERGIVF